METSSGHAYSVRNVVDGQTVSIIGEGQFCIGLTLDERMACSSQHNMSTKSKSLSSSLENDGSIAVPLMLLTVWKTSGVTVIPASRDLKCKLNGENIEMETHFIPGSHIEVGDKVFELLEGTAAKQPRRHLPPTPGIPIFPIPPPKPQRVNIKKASCDSNESGNQDVMREWCLIQLPNSERELLEQTKDPNQLANLASSYLTRHISVHTDVVMSIELTDDIFKMMQEIAHHRRDILRHFLSEVISEVIDEEKNSQDDSHHAKVTGLLVEILQQFLDPRYLVLLCLQLLRALSHIPRNVSTMVANNTTAAVLGSMAVYKDDEKIQNNCLDILAKLSTFLPAVLDKPPLRESSIDLMSMAVRLHFNNLTIVQAGIRSLANLASTLHLLAFAAMKGSSNSDLQTYMRMVTTVLDYLYNTALPLVQDALAVFCNDLTVKTDGRRFLFEYAKMEQLKSQHKLWNLACTTMSINTTHDDSNYEDGQSELDERCMSSGNCHENGASMETDGENGTSGILKKSRSYENLRNSHRRVSFVHEDDLPPSSSSSSSSVNSSPVNLSHEIKQGGSPDIKVMSRSRIYPTAVWSGDSTDHETGPYLEVADGEQADYTSKQISSACQPGGDALVQPEGNANADVNFSQQNEDTNIKNPPCSSDDLPINDTRIITSNGSVTLDLNSPEYSSSCCGLYPYIPVDVTNFRYSAADVVYMKRLMSLQITCLVCSASVHGLDPPALKLIDMPLSQLLSFPGIPNAMWQFANSQFEEDARLMDLDPGTVISVIDAVRYKVLAFDLVRKSLQMIIQNLSPKIHAKMLEVTREVIESIITDTALSDITAEQEFVTSLEHEMENVKQVFSQSHSTISLIDGISSMIRSRLKHHQEHLQN